MRLLFHNYKSREVINTCFLNSAFKYDINNQIGQFYILIFSSGSVLSPFNYNGFVAKIEFLSKENNNKVAPTSSSLGQNSGSGSNSGQSSGSNVRQQKKDEPREDAEEEEEEEAEEEDYEEETQKGKKNWFNLKSIFKELNLSTTYEQHS